MKILHVAPIGHAREGIGTVLENLCPEQKKLGNEVRIITKKDNLIYKDKSIVSIKSPRVFESYITEWKPEIIIFHSHFHIEYYWFSRIARKKNIPYCVQLHGALSKSNYKKNHLKKVVFGYLIFNRILKNAHTIIYLNEAELKNSIVPQINPHSEILPNGCETNDVFLPKTDIKDLIKIVFIGRIHYYHKGIDVLIEALQLLDKDYHNDFHVYFYGNEVDTDVHRLKKDLSNLKNASYEGEAYGEKKKGILKEADFFILTSRYEGMPMGVLEAWSYGIPCLLSVGTNMITPKTEKNSFWKVELTPTSIAETIVAAIKDYKINPTLYENASYTEAKKYSWRLIAEKSMKVYGKVINK